MNAIKKDFNEFLIHCPACGFQCNYKYNEGKKPRKRCPNCGKMSYIKFWLKNSTNDQNIKDFFQTCFDKKIQTKCPNCGEISFYRYKNAKRPRKKCKGCGFMYEIKIDAEIEEKNLNKSFKLIKLKIVSGEINPKNCREIPLKSWTLKLFIENGYLVKLTSKSVIFHIHYYAKDQVQDQKHLLHEILALKQIIEKKYDCILADFNEDSLSQERYNMNHFQSLFASYIIDYLNQFLGEKWQEGYISLVEKKDLFFLGYICGKNNVKIPFINLIFND